MIRSFIPPVLAAMFVAGCTVQHTPTPASEPYAEPRPVQTVYREPAPVYTQPTPVYREPTPVYREPTPVYREPAPAAARWEKLGQVRVNGRRDVDSLPVGRHEGRFRTLRIRVTDSSLRMHDIRIVFTDGTVYSPNTELRFSQGETQTIDLPGNTRTIKRVDFRYSDTRQRDTAVVEVWGR